MLMTRYVESEVLGAENSDSKFKQPYYGKDGLDFGRDNKGRFRRKLVTPITNTEYEKGMLTKRIISTPSNPSPPLELDLFDDDEFITVSATLRKDFWEDILNGDESINEVDWDIEN